ncbi:unnamed protein product, partial [Closterium sp. NIES-54]
MHSRLLVSGLPRSLPPLPPSPAPPCLPCVKGRQRAAPHSSSFPPTTAPCTLSTWTCRAQPASVDRAASATFCWLLTTTRVHLQLCERFSADLSILRLHSDRGGELSSDLQHDFCRGEGILQSFMLPDSPQQNGIAERRIGLVMEVARTSMIHAAAPHFLRPFATSPTLRWTGKVGDASIFRVWGSRAFVRDTSADKLSAHAIPCVFLGFVPDAPGWQFYHPTLRHVFPSQDVTFDESVPFYILFPYRSAPLPPPPLFLAPGPPSVDPLPPPGPATSGVTLVVPPPGAVPGEVAVDSGAARVTASGDAKLGDSEPGGAETEGAAPRGTKIGGPETGGAETGGAEPEGVERGVSTGASLRLSPQQLRECLVRHARLRSGATRARGAGAAGAGGAGVTAGAGVPRGIVATGPGDARTRGNGAAKTGGVGGAGAGQTTESGAAGAGGSGTGGAGAGGAGVGGARAGAGGAGVGGTGVGGAGTGGAGAVDPGGTVRPRPYFVPLLQQPASPLPAPSPYTEQTGGLKECREPTSRPSSPFRTARRVPRPCPPPVPGTHAMTLPPSSVPLRVPLPAPPEFSLPEVPDPESDRARATSPIVSHLLATAVTDPSFESAAASALVAGLLEFATACRLDYATALVAEFPSASPPSVRGECALGTDVLEDRQEDFESLAAAIPRFASMLLASGGDSDAPDIPTPRSYAEAITEPYSSQWQAAMDAEMASWKSTGTYVDEVPPPGANIVDGMWIFWVKRPPGSLPTFKARYVARGFIYGLRQAPREWHNTLRTTLAALGFAPSTADPSPFYILVYVNDLAFASADTEALTLVLQRFGFQSTSPQVTPRSTGHSLSAPPSDESVEPSGLYPELVGCLMYLMTCTRPDLAYPLSLLACYVAPRRHRKVHWDAAKWVLRYLCSTSGMGLVLGGQGPVVLTGYADASWVDDLATQRSSQGYTFSL